MKYSLDQLSAFKAAAECGSFSAAARRLGKAQSLISTAIANLEIDLGISLFNREGRYPQLSAEGARLLPEAIAILQRCDQLSGIAHGLTAGQEAKLRLAVDDSAQMPWLGDLLQQLAAKFPHLELELLFPIMEDLYKLLLSGRVDLGISYEAAEHPKELAFHALRECEMQFVVSRQHPLALEKTLTLEMLQNHRQLMVTGRHSGAEKERFRYSPSVWWVEGDWAVLELVRRGLGWACLPNHFADLALEQDIVQLPIRHFESSLQLGVQLVWHPAHSLGQAGQWLKETLIHNSSQISGKSG
ncbi:LysR family transcriptional regulator [Iodobacter sp. HSC-16F04]|uniref:LysR family transcriptional regulator n=1 Tax=Iodobacter violaceini TaxID=3044271 RepID=A0ABX0KRA4_9NEIS|nr:LysR family transcriptional regulator [Iodobacter violacea]NHQ86447.1 LysR family transcriptional regulator [Iodobacter violacea]